MLRFLFIDIPAAILIAIFSGVLAIFGSFIFGNIVYLVVLIAMFLVEVPNILRFDTDVYGGLSIYYVGPVIFGGLVAIGSFFVYLFSAFRKSVMSNNDYYVDGYYHSEDYSIPDYYRPEWEKTLSQVAEYFNPHKPSSTYETSPQWQQDISKIAQAFSKYDHYYEFDDRRSNWEKDVSKISRAFPSNEIYNSDDRSPQWQRDLRRIANTYSMHAKSSTSDERPQWQKDLETIYKGMKADKEAPIFEDTALGKIVLKPETRAILKESRKISKQIDKILEIHRSIDYSNLTPTGYDGSYSYDEKSQKKVWIPSAEAQKAMRISQNLDRIAQSHGHKNFADYARKGIDLPDFRKK